MKVFRDLSWFFKQEKKAYLKGIFFLLIIAILQLIPPRIIGLVADDISSGSVTWKKLLIWSITLLFLGLIMYFLRYYWRVYIFGSSLKLSRILRKQLYDHFTLMAPTFYQKKRIGDLMAHATNDVQAVEDTAGAGVLTLVDSLFAGGFAIMAMALTVDWRLTIISLLPMPIIAIATYFLGLKLNRRFELAQEAFSSLNDKTQESISGIKILKALGHEKEDIEDFKTLSNDVVQKNIQVAKIDALYDPIISVVVGFSFFLSIGIGAKFVLDGSLTIGELIAFNTYLGLLVWPMLAFGWLFNILERGRASYDRIKRLLNDKIQIEEAVDSIDKKPKGKILFKIDSFSYPNAKLALKDIAFKLQPGETLGIVGKTGSGKSTLIKLLIREFDHFNGDITIGDIPISKYKLDVYRKVFGYVPQDNFLFSSTIKENIAFAKPDAKKEDIERAAKIAHIHDDILALPNGYDTLVGERGVSLSGGQKQRISIARAILLDPEILILDDSISAVDAKTEEAILKALKVNRKGKTTIISSHRLSAVEHADLILVLENGRIVERGQHKELMKNNGWYKKMYLHQQLESLVEKGG